MRLISAIAAIAVFVCPSVPRAESVYVKYRGDVDLKFFDWSDITRSSFINRVCYDRRNEYMLISLNGTFYHYCEIDASTVSSLLSAPSMGGSTTLASRASLIAGFIECLNIELSGDLSAAPHRDRLIHSPSARPRDPRRRRYRLGIADLPK
jgi:hypothetical protein